MEYTNSPLVVYTKLSPNNSGLRKHSIDRISPHCVVGQCSVETLGNIFAPISRNASSNYGIGSDGRVGMYCEEKNRSWCTSSNANDQRAVTIECASDTTHPYAMNNKVYETLINLCVDICQRNGKKKLLWLKDKEKTLSYSPAEDEMIITVHRWFANKACPGDWLFNRLGDLAQKVTERLGGVEVVVPVDTEDESVLYKVQTGAYKVKTNADKQAEKLKALGFDTLIVKSGNLYKVQCGAFRKKANAEVLRDKLKAKGFDTMIVSVGAEQTPVQTPTEQPTDVGKTIWDYLIGKGLNEYAVAGIMGNLHVESGLRSNNLQNTYEKKLGMTDEQYTAAVDNGTYTNFVHDSAGYGLAQWTYWSRKEGLLKAAQAAKKSISDLGVQLDYLWKELQWNNDVMRILKGASDVKTASDVILTKFEKPADQSDKAKKNRASYAQNYFDKYAHEVVTPEETFKEYKVRVTIKCLNVRERPTTDSKVVDTIRDCGIYTIVGESNGSGAKKWGKLKSNVGWISLDYTLKV